MEQRVVSLKKQAKNIVDRVKDSVDYYMNKCDFSILHLPRGKKIPLAPWTQLQKEKMKKDALHAFFGAPSNVGIVTGKFSGVVVIDVDGKKGWDSLKEKGITYKDLKDFPHTKTGRPKGYHFFFKYPNDGKKYGNKQNVLEGIDVRGEGGYATAPPSLHEESNKEYKWVVLVNQQNLVPMPDELFKITMFASTSKKSELSEKKFTLVSAPSLETVSNLEEKIVEIIEPYWKKGMRHSLALSLVGFLMKSNVDKSKIINIMKSICERTNDPDIEDRLKSIETTSKLNVEDIKGISGLSEYLEPETTEQLKSLFQTSAFFFVSNIGFNDKGIYYLDKNGNKIFICHGKYQFVYNKIYKSIYGENNVYVVWINGKLVEIYLEDLIKPRERLYMELTKQRVEISISNVSKIVDLINSSLAHLDYPIYETYGMMGWNGHNLIIPNLERKDNLLDDDSEFLGWNEQSGNVENLRKVYDPSIMKICSALFVALGHTAISMMLPLMHKKEKQIRHIAVHLVGETGSGKTTAAKCAMSFFGDPEILKQTWDLTRVAFEDSLANNGCMPLYLDETTIKDEKRNENIGQWLYSYEQGIGKKIGFVEKKTGNVKTKNRKKWRLNLLSTGEGSLIKGAGKGTQGRAIELYLIKGDYTKSVGIINKYCLGMDDEEVCEPNYGWGLKLFSDFLEENGKEGLKKILEFCLEKYYETKKEIQVIKTESVPDKRLMVNWALIGTGYELVCKILNIKYTKEDIIFLIKKSWSECYFNDEFSNDPDTLYQKVLAFYSENCYRFANSKKEYFETLSLGQSNLKGFTDKNKEGQKILYILQGSFPEVIKDLPMTHTGIMRKQLIDKGFMIANDKKKGIFKTQDNGSRYNFLAFVLNDKKGNGNVK